MGKISDGLRREQEEESRAEADKIVSGGRADGHGAFTGEIARRDREKAKQQEVALRDALRKFRGEIDRDADVASLMSKYPMVSNNWFWGAVKAERASRHPRENSNSQEAESGDETHGFLPPHRYFK